MSTGEQQRFAMDTVRASSATTAMASMVEQLPPSPLDATMPVAKTTLLFRADVWNVRRREFECVRVLADSFRGTDVY